MIAIILERQAMLLGDRNQIDIVLSQRSSLHMPFAPSPYLHPSHCGHPLLPVYLPDYQRQHAS